MEENLSFRMCDIYFLYAYNIHKFLLYILLRKFDRALKYFNAILVIIFIMNMLAWDLTWTWQGTDYAGWRFCGLPWQVLGYSMESTSLFILQELVCYKSIVQIYKYFQNISEVGDKKNLTTPLLQEIILFIVKIFHKSSFWWEENSHLLHILLKLNIEVQKYILFYYNFLSCLAAIFLLKLLLLLCL